MNEIVETEDHNYKDKASESKGENEESETCESDEINVAYEEMNKINSIYKVLDVNSNLLQVGRYETCLTKIQDSELHGTKPAKGTSYTAGTSSIRIVMINNQEERIILDTAACCTCVEKISKNTYATLGR
ncbi:hypothetical protein O181_073826 [Austropuccinia psidii MF-1]|uniref:Uncharacterized protein n=1 Tax=Austropuccinia psidii MF-1 TaxID=1389203 RepID=A0A9Q3FBW7_9BASI|nr:hypothetical protein [Austropuccinia psidii MF-1]